MSRTRNEQISQSLESTSSDTEDELEFEVECRETVKQPTKQKKSIPEEPVGTVSHQKFCIRCGSADNLFRNNKYKTCIVCCNKTKRPPQSEKQKEAFQRCKAKRLENVEKRKAALKEFEQKAKSELDTKIVRKAIAVKKKQIIREAQLDEVSDEEDTPLEQVVKVAKKTEAKKRAVSKRLVKNVEQEIEKKDQLRLGSRVNEIVEPQEQYYHAQPSFSFA